VSSIATLDKDTDYWVCYKLLKKTNNTNPPPPTPPRRSIRLSLNNDDVSPIMLELPSKRNHGLIRKVDESLDEVIARQDAMVGKMSDNM